MFLCPSYRRREVRLNVSAQTLPPLAHHPRLAHTSQWTAQRLALSPMTLHRNVEARTLGECVWVRVSGDL
jgi:hypothetical protein